MAKANLEEQLALARAESEFWRTKWQCERQRLIRLKSAVTNLLAALQDDGDEDEEEPPEPPRTPKKARAPEPPTPSTVNTRDYRRRFLDALLENTS